MQVSGYDVRDGLSLASPTPTLATFGRSVVSEARGGDRPNPFLTYES